MVSFFASLIILSPSSSPSILYLISTANVCATLILPSEPSSVVDLTKSSSGTRITRE